MGLKCGAQEWKDSVLLQNIIEPPDLTRHCNFCIVGLYIAHAFDCKKVVLVTSCQSELRNKVFNLYIKALTPTHVRVNPLIHLGSYVQINKAFQFCSNLPNNPLFLAIDSEYKVKLLI